MRIAPVFERRDMHKHRPGAQKKGALCGAAQTSAVQVQVRRKLCGSQLRDGRKESDLQHVLPAGPPLHPAVCGRKVLELWWCHECTDVGFERSHEKANYSANKASNKISHGSTDAQLRSRSVRKTRGAGVCRFLQMRLVHCKQLRQWLRAWYQ